MKVYVLTYVIGQRSGDRQPDCEILVIGESKDDAMRRGIKRVIAERERWGYMCDYDGANVFVCHPNGNLCETYTDFKVEEV